MVSTSGIADCIDPSAGYCITFDDTILSSFFTPGGLPTGDSIFLTDFGWLASPAGVNKTGRKDFATYADTRAIHCALSTLPSGHAGEFEARRDSPVCY